MHHKQPERVWFRLPLTGNVVVLCGVAVGAAWVLLGVAVGWWYLPEAYKEWYRSVRVLRPLDYLTLIAIPVALLLDLIGLATGHRALAVIRGERERGKGSINVRLALVLGYVNLLVVVAFGLVIVWGIVMFIYSDPDYIPRCLPDCG